ncbi:MAG TPA: hypothetical protein ACQGQI_07495, partial [Xylella sp.]
MRPPCAAAARGSPRSRRGSAAVSQAAVVHRPEDAEGVVRRGRAVPLGDAVVPVAHTGAVRAKFGQRPVEPVGQVLLAVVAVVVLGPLGERLCRQVEVECLAQGD